MNWLKVFVVSTSIIFLTACGGLGGKNTDPIVITEPEQPAVIQSTLQQGETLWDFSERTTGSGFNWETIAVLNSIEDEYNVDAGLVLVVPPELALEELKNQ